VNHNPASSTFEGRIAEAVERESPRAYLVSGGYDGTANTFWFRDLRSGPDALGGVSYSGKMVFWANPAAPQVVVAVSGALDWLQYHWDGAGWQPSERWSAPCVLVNPNPFG
jgi:hypothetical protein